MTDREAVPTLVKVNPPTLPLDCQPAYASVHNFSNRIVYNSINCYLRPEAAEALARACALAANDGLNLRLFDAYRPKEVQYFFWSLIPDENFIAHPVKGSTHGRGIAVDVTLLDERRMPLPMGTEFDEFTEAAHHDYADLADEIIANRRRLRTYMEAAGFVIHAPEWWHYNLPEPKLYPLIGDGEAAPRLLRPEVMREAEMMRLEMITS
jgi:zinc D-Ala-D-Ala dipeptidase